MKEKSNATLRRAASLRCRTDAAIERLGRNISCYERGYITAGELLREASDAADRAGNLELSEPELAATDSFGRSVNRKVKAYRGYARTAARIAMGYKSNAECRRQALAFARTAARLGNRLRPGQSFALCEWCYPKHPQGSQVLCQYESAFQLFEMSLKAGVPARLSKSPDSFLRLPAAEAPSEAPVHCADNCSNSAVPAGCAASRA